MNATCRANSTCRKIANERKYECPCDSDTVPVSDETASEEMCLGIFDMIILLSLRLYDFYIGLPLAFPIRKFNFTKTAVYSLFRAHL